MMTGGGQGDDHMFRMLAAEQAYGIPDDSAGCGPIIDEDDRVVRDGLLRVWAAAGSFPAGETSGSLQDGVADLVFAEVQAVDHRAVKYPDTSGSDGSKRRAAAAGGGDFPDKQNVKRLVEQSGDLSSYRDASLGQGENDHAPGFGVLIKAFRELPARFLAVFETLDLFCVHRLGGRLVLRARSMDR